MALAIRRPYAWAYLAILFFGYAIAGWILTAYAAPKFVWALTLLLTVHLAKVGPDAIALSITWIVALLWGAAYIGAHPQDIRWTVENAWGISLLVLWLLAVLLVLLLAFAGPFIPQRKGHNAHYFLIKLIWGSLATGMLTYLWRGTQWLG